MKNPIEVVKEIGYDLAFLPNDYNDSKLCLSQKWIRIGIESRKKDIFDFPFICLAHEAGHALDKELLTEECVLKEIKAWKIAFKEFLTEQPEIRLRIQKDAQFHLNRYVEYYIFGETPDDIESDNNL